MVQAVDPTRRGAPLDHGKGEGFRPQHSLLASADLWILEVLRAQEIPCSFFSAWLWLPLGLDAALRCWWYAVWLFQHGGSLTFLTCPPSFKKWECFWMCELIVKEMFGKSNLHPLVAFCHCKIGLILDYWTVGFLLSSLDLLCFGFCPVGGFMSHTDVWQGQAMNPEISNCSRLVLRPPFPVFWLWSLSVMHGGN